MLIAELNSGYKLAVSPQLNNPNNATSFLVDVVHGDSVGWVSDRLCGEIATMFSAGYALSVVTEQENLDVSA